MPAPEAVIKDFCVHCTQSTRWRCGSVELSLDGVELLHEVAKLEENLIVIRCGDLVLRRKKRNRPNKMRYPLEYVALKAGVTTNIIGVDRIARKGEARLLIWANNDDVCAEVEKALKVVAFEPVCNAFFPGVILRLCKASRLAIRPRLPERRKLLLLRDGRLGGEDVFEPRDTGSARQRCCGRGQEVFLENACCEGLVCCSVRRHWR